VAPARSKSGRGRAFELLSTQERLHRARIGAERRIFSSLVGRERELAVMRGCLERLRQGQGGIASVVAERAREIAPPGRARGERGGPRPRLARGPLDLDGPAMSLHPSPISAAPGEIGDEDDEASAARVRASAPA